MSAELFSEIATSSSLITSEHKKLAPLLLYMCTLVPRSIMGSFFFQHEKRPVGIEEAEG